MPPRKSPAVVLLALAPLLAGIRPTPAQTTTQATAPDRAALKVLDAYAATLDKIKTKGLSITVELEETVEGKNRPPNSPIGMPDGTYKRQRLIEASWDGYRIYTHRLFWGDFGPQSRDVKKEDGVHDYHLFDGKRNFGYASPHPLYPGLTGAMVVASTEKRPDLAEFARVSPIPEALGYFKNYLRLDKVLRDAKSLSIEESAPDAVVIRAKTQYGTYSVTFDPTHDFHYTRLERQIAAGDRDTPGAATLVGGYSVTMTFDSVQFKKFGDLWMPVEFHWINDCKNGDAPARLDGTPQPGQSSRNDTHTRVTALQLAPDFKARRSFEPTFLPEGTTLRFDNGQQVPAVYQEVVWKQGRLTSAPASTTPSAQSPRNR
jgi:hypothetical protein